MILGFGNNVVSAIAADITATQTTIPVMPGNGAQFAELLTYDQQNSSNLLDVYAKVTLTDSGETVYEICHLTAVNGDNLTVIRGQEKTDAKGWSLNDVVANFATRGSENAFVQIEHLQTGHYTTATAGGTANALTIDLPSTFFIDESTSWALKTPIIVIPTVTNTGSCTLLVTLSGMVIGTFPLYKGNKQQLEAGDLVVGLPILCLLDTTKSFFTTINPNTLYSKFGTAAYHNVQTSPTDTTAGSVLMVGAFGLGGSSPAQIKDEDILSANVTPTQFFDQGGGTDNQHFGGYGTGIHLNYGTASGGTQRATANLFIDSAGNLSVEWLAVNIDDSSIVASKLQKLYGPLNKPTATDVKAVPFFGQIAAGTNLNSLTSEGVWFNPANANATLALNYPSTQAGSLQILQDAGTTQIYTEYAGGKQFRRGLYNGNWSAWLQVYDSYHSQDLSAYITTSSANSKFLQGVQYGAKGTYDYNMDGIADAPNGYAMTGILAGGGDGNGQFHAKPIQRNINGTWVTISG